MNSAEFICNDNDNEVRGAKVEVRGAKVEGRRLCRNDDVNVDENRLRIQISELPPDENLF